MSRRVFSGNRVPCVWDPGVENQGFVHEDGEKPRKPSADTHSRKHTAEKSPGKQESRLHRFFRRNPQRRKSESQKLEAGRDDSPEIRPCYSTRIRLESAGSSPISELNDNSSSTDLNSSSEHSRLFIFFNI